MDLQEKEWYIEAPWGRICIVAWGDCFDPPVLLCHGAMDSAACFRPLIKLLPKKFYYIAMELPGNGKSDHFPGGMMITAFDMVYAITVIVKHFRWKNFHYIGHSLGAIFGFLFDLSYPGKMTKIVQLDPVPRALTIPSNEFAEWYHTHFTKYFEQYKAFNLSVENGPKYERKEAIEKLMSNRGLNEDNAIATLQRLSKSAGNGYIRYTFDQRMKLVCRPPISPEYLKKLLTTIKTPTLAIVAEESIKNNRYLNCEFFLDEKQFPNGNYRVRRVGGNHDLHFVHPEKVAGFVGHFLLYNLEGLDSNSKL